MGACQSNAMTPEQQAQYEEDMRKERVINKQTSDERVQDQKIYKLLLLGAGESGKSTLFKQMLTIYGKGISREELKALVPAIHVNLILGMIALCTNVDNWAQVLPENEEAQRLFQGISSSEVESLQLTALHFQYLKQLWLDPAIQTAWSHRSEYQIYDSTEYFFAKLDQIQAPDYQPTEDDHLRIRVRTTGIVESLFQIEGNQFKLHDVGGQRNERQKWIHCFENVTAVIFVAAISEYDQKLFEDETTNRLDEALKLFDDICNARWFSKTAMLLFLNKRDLFQEKIMRIPLNQFFPAYQGGPNDYQAAQTWITDQFLARNKNHNQKVYTSVTTAVDSTNVRMVINSVKDIIIRQALAFIGA